MRTTLNQLYKNILTEERRLLNPLKWWEDLGLDTRSFLMMLKGALAPTITIAMYVCRVILVRRLRLINAKISKRCDLQHDHHDRLPVSLDLGALTGIDAPGKVHEDHVLRLAIYLRLCFTLLSSCLLCSQGERT